MTKILTLLVLMLLSFNAGAQTYSGISADKSFKCILSILPDSTVTMVVYSLKADSYHELYGTLKKGWGSNYVISRRLIYGGHLTNCLPPDLAGPDPNAGNDSFRFSVDTPFISLNDTIEMRYYNGKRDYYIPYDSSRVHNYYTLNRKLMKESKSGRYVIATFRKKNLVTGKNLFFRIPINHCLNVYYITRSDLVYIEIKGTNITFGYNSGMTGKIVMTKL